MEKFEDVQAFGKEQMNAATSAAAVMSQNVQAIAAAMTDYTKRSFEDSTKAFEKLLAAKSFDKAFEVQTEYAKSAYETFMSEASKIGELYTTFAKEAYKPFENYVSKFGSNIR